MKSGKALQDTLLKIQNGETYDIWNLLPDSAGGAAWLDEIKDAACTLREWLDADKDYDLDDLRDMTGSIANNEIEDYYANINQRVQDLALWACDEIDLAVSQDLVLWGDPALQLDRATPTLTDLNSRYLYAGMRELYDAIADEAYENTEVKL
jgi:hypothetical protein